VATFPYTRVVGSLSTAGKLLFASDMGVLEGEWNGSAFAGEVVLRGDRRITRLGRQMAALPVDPRLARILVEAARTGCLREALVIATQIGDEAWMRELRGRLALLNVHDAEALRRRVKRMIAGVQPSQSVTRTSETSTPAFPDEQPSPELLNTLQAAFKYIETESFQSTFQGLFSEINLASDKLGKKYEERNAKLCTIIQKIAEGLTQFSTDADTLGDAYEYLIGQFAAGSGKKAGEFYTPQQISSILSGIVTLDSQEPKTGKKAKLDSILDFACGSGSLLLNVRKRMGPHGISKIFGQEKNITTYNLARMNMLLHGVKDTEFEIYHGDTLTNDWDMLLEPNPAKMPKFDAVVANPPFSYRWDPNEALGEDVRFKNYGLAPKSAADLAFLLHGFHYLKNDGVMAIILPHGVLFRGGAEERIRTKLPSLSHRTALTRNFSRASR
jgi:type I restriction-modification system DNA methylase subunit